ncbi:hypothetical protein [Rossellomorea aquimaris]|uniref:hypothetical protein n=1 Tax=Rossellomorea aquimaris TaxID=189382 RepID=UPI002495352F|nr:hypothetical protein [Rossellomorea aquimaris]
MRKETATPKDVKKLIRTLKRKHEESKPSILERVNIEDKDLLKGVICVACNHRPLVRKHGTWFCLKCDSRNNDAHIQALKDYELLIAPTINNSELREYLVVDSPYVAKRLLQSLNLPTTGTKKGTQYILSSDESPARKHKQKNPPTI